MRKWDGKLNKANLIRVKGGGLSVLNYLDTLD